MAQSSQQPPSRELMPVKRFEWERWVRRVAMPRTAKLVALTLGSFANQDGTNVRPGRDRIANVCGITPRTVSRAFVALREMGLVDRTYRGSGSAHHSAADVYRLTIPSDLLEREEVTDPDEMPNRVGDTTVTRSPSEHVTPQSPSKARLSDTTGQEHVTFETEHVTPHARACDTSVTPPDHTNQRPDQDHVWPGSQPNPKVAQDDEQWPPKGCGCNRGFIGNDDQGRPVPCQRCKPHLAKVIPLPEREAI